jgi:hypothetical protein
MSRILRDALERPDLFHWNGPIDSTALDAWLQLHGMDRCPRDLRRFWEATGGGDLFETETILGPFGKVEWGDDVLGQNEVDRDGRLTKSRLVFARDDHGFGGVVDLDSGQYLGAAAGESFRSLDDWYVSTLRNEYAARYGLR